MTIREKEKLLDLFFKLKNPEDNEEYQKIISSIEEIYRNKEENETALENATKELKEYESELSKFKSGVKVLDQMYEAIKENSELSYALAQLSSAGTLVEKNLDKIVREDGERDTALKLRNGQIDKIKENITRITSIIEEASYESSIDDLETKKAEIEEIIDELQKIYQSAIDESIRNEIPSVIESKLTELLGLTEAQAKSLQGILQNEHEVLIEYDEHGKLFDGRKINTFSYTPINTPKKEFEPTPEPVTQDNKFKQDNLSEPSISNEEFMESKNRSEELDNWLNNYSNPEPLRVPEATKEVSKLEEDALKELAPITPNLVREFDQVKEVRKPVLDVGDALFDFGLWFSPEIEEYLKNNVNVKSLIDNLSVCKNNGIDVKKYIGALKLIFEDEKSITDFLTLISIDNELAYKITKLKVLGASNDDITFTLGNILSTSLESINNNTISSDDILLSSILTSSSVKKAPSLGGM